MRVGSNVQLKEKINGRRFPGKITKIHNVAGVRIFRVTFSSGYYVEFPEELWELDDKVREESENLEQGNSIAANIIDGQLSNT